MFNVAKVQKIYIAVGYSDLRRGIDGFASIIQNTFHMNLQKADKLFLDCSAAAAPELIMWEPQTAQIFAETEMAKRNVRMTVDVHPLSAFATAFTLWQIQFSLKTVNCFPRRRIPDESLCVMEAKQTGRNLEVFC